MQWVTPPRGDALPLFGTAAFTASREHPVPAHRVPLGRVTADRRADRRGDAIWAAQAERAGGRLDPPLVVVLDEPTNIVALRDVDPIFRPE
jgi:hypothetical protein